MIARLRTRLGRVLRHGLRRYVTRRGEPSFKDSLAPPSARPTPAAPSLTPHDRQDLETLLQRAWRFERLPQRDFSLGLTDGDPERIFAALYSHARLWAPGLDVPHALPRLRFVPTGMGPTGSFGVSHDGWTSVEVCASLRGRPAALARVLAHEASHHILEHAGLAVRNNDPRNERRTELAMFVCGFGKIAIDGDDELAAMGLRCDPALGYMDRLTMLATERVVTECRRSMTPARAAEAWGGMLETQARSLFNEPGQYERMLAGYSRVLPGASEQEVLSRMLEEYRRDRR